MVASSGVRCAANSRNLALLSGMEGDKELNSLRAPTAKEA